MEGTTGRQRVPKVVLENYYLPLPPLHEQRRIAAVLNTIQEAIAVQDDLIVEVRDVKRSLMHRLFSTGPNSESVETKDTEIGEIPVHWHVKRFGDVATLQRGKDLPVQDRTEGDVPIVGSNGIAGYHNEYFLEDYCLTVGRSGSVGKVFLYEGQSWALNTALYVKDFHNNNQQFIYYLLSMFDFRPYATGVSVPTLNRNFVHEALLPVPPIEEQIEISIQLLSIDQKIAVEEDRKAALQDLFKTMLHELMTGHIRLMSDQ